MGNDYVPLYGMISQEMVPDAYVFDSSMLIRVVSNFNDTLIDP
jgi:hypothetical protein